MENTSLQICLEIYRSLLLFRNLNIVNSENILERLNKSVNRLIYKTLIVSLCAAI